MNKVKRLSGLILSFFMIISLSSSLSAQYKLKNVSDEEGKAIQMKVNTKTGSPHRIYNLKQNFTNYGDFSNKENIEKCNAQFLNEISGFIKVDIKDLKLKQIKKSSTRKDKWYISYQQYYKGVPVYRADVGYTLLLNGNIELFGSDAYPDISLDVSHKLSGNEALQIAETHFKELSKSDTLTIRKEPELIILPIEKEDDYCFFS